MAGLIVVGNHPRGYLPGLKDIYGFEYDRYPVEYPEFFRTEKSEKRWEDVISMSGMGLAVVKNEGQSITYDDFRQGLVTRFIHVMYGKGFMVSKEAMDDYLYAPDLVALGAKYMAESMRQTKETIAANVINNGYSSSYNITDQGSQPLFSTSHVLVRNNGTYANCLSVGADLAEASLESAMINIMNLTDDAGLKVAITPRKLVVTVNDIFNAKRILGDPALPPWQVDTANRNPNAIRVMGMLPEGYVVNHFLTLANTWFMTTSRNDKGMVMFERQDVEFDADNDFDTKSAKFSVIERYIPACEDPRGVYGSCSGT